MVTGFSAGTSQNERILPLTSTTRSQAFVEVAERVPMWLVCRSSVAWDARLRPYRRDTIPRRMTLFQRPEEINLFLAFFHLSGLVRYNPSLAYRLEDSRFWPMLLTFRRHGLLRALTLAWEFAHQSHTEFV